MYKGGKNLEEVTFFGDGFAFGFVDQYSIRS